MTTPESEAVGRLLELAAPETDPILDEMARKARESDFPIVGPETGGFYRLCARLVGAESVFEFGSGFGYSAYWVVSVLPADGGRVVLTEHDADELDLAREYFVRGGYDDRATFEVGDAIETLETYDGPFDLVLVDNEDHRYVEAFEAVHKKVARGGVVLADNVLDAGKFGPADLVSVLDGEAGTPSTRGVADYYEHLRDDPDFEATLIPVGKGVLAGVRL